MCLDYVIQKMLIYKQQLGIYSISAFVNFAFKNKKQSKKKWSNISNKIKKIIKTNKTKTNSFRIFLRI